MQAWSTGAMLSLDLAATHVAAAELDRMEQSQAGWKPVRSIF